MRNPVIIEGIEYTPAMVSAFASADSNPLSGVMDFLRCWYDSRDYIEQRTSGSTGKPKVIRLKKVHMWNSARATNTFFSLRSGDNILLALSPDYIAGKMMIVRALAGKMNLLVTSVASTPQLPREKIRFAAFVPMQLENILDSNEDFRNVEMIILGGAPVSSQLMEKIGNVAARVYATYGMSETCSHVAVKRLNGTNADDSFRTLPGVTATVTEDGCICINAPHLAAGEVLTTDIGRVPRPGRLIIDGRNDFIINSGGVKINPFPVEALISKAIGHNVLLIPLNDIKTGYKAVVVVEGMATNELREKTEHVINEIRSSYPIIRSPLFLEAFPRNRFYKVDRNAVIRHFEVDRKGPK